MIRVSKAAIIDEIRKITVDLREMQTRLDFVAVYAQFIAEQPDPNKKVRGRPVGTRNKEGHRAGRPRKSFNPIMRAGDL
jgi:hypothetical protein